MVANFMVMNPMGSQSEKNHQTNKQKTTWMSQEVGKCLVNGLFHLLIHGVYWGYNPLNLTFDPNFLKHPSRSRGPGAGKKHIA